MRKITLTLAVATVVSVAMTLGAAAQEGKPEADELATISAALAAQGYTRWESIEWDDDGWEVDDAVSVDGREDDLWLNPDTLQIVRAD